MKNLKSTRMSYSDCPEIYLVGRPLGVALLTFEAYESK